MPIYSYRCTSCGAQDLRVAGLDDDMAVCVKCHGRMLRLDDPFANPCAWCLAARGEKAGPGVSHGICKRHKEELLKEAGCHD